jgi:uncharacterized protein (TIGR03086 family)
MELDVLDCYRRASDWTVDKVAGATDLDGPTPCTDWSVRDLLNHMLETQQYFRSAARGEPASPPGKTPPALLTDDPAGDFARGRDAAVETFGAADLDDRGRMMLGIAFADMLLHGWDLAKATGQDATMPDGLADAAYATIHGRLTDEQRKGVFGPEIPVGADATPQQRLLAYTGRTPD